LLPAEREAILKQLADSRERLLDSVQSLSPAQRSFRPGSGRWTVGENVEHIVVVEKRVLAGIQRALGEPLDPSKKSAFENQDADILNKIAIVDTPLQAPEPVRPTGRWHGKALLDEFELTRKSTSEFVAGAMADLKQHCLPHPFFGLLSCYQWLLAVSAHCDRHHKQIEQIKSASAFPPS
jgi:hypothetical protein